MAWIKHKYTGVRYREHPSRSHNGRPDRYYSIYYTVNGKRREEGFGWASSDGATAIKAKNIRSVLRNNIIEGKHPQSLEEMRQLEIDRKIEKARKIEALEKENISLGTAGEIFFSWLTENRKAHKGEKSKYDNHIKPAFETIPLKDILNSQLECFKQDLFKKGLSSKTVHSIISIIRAIYRKAKKWELYSGSIPTDSFDFPRINNKRIRYLTQEEAKKLLDALKKRSLQTHDQTLLALYSGMRTSEILNVRWRDIDFNSGVIHLQDTKSNEAQKVLFPEIVKIMLLKRLPETPTPNNFVFEGIKGGRQFKISDTFTRTVEELGFNNDLEKKDSINRVVFHTLRHTFCSWLAMAGVPLFTIQELARHKDITMTQRYSHLCPDHKRDALSQLEKSLNNI